MSGATLNRPPVLKEFAVPTFSTRILAAAVAFLEGSLALLQHPTPIADLNVFAAMTVVVISAACFVAGSTSRNARFGGVPDRFAGRSLDQ